MRTFFIIGFSFVLLAGVVDAVLYGIGYREPDAISSVLDNVLIAILALNVLLAVINSPNVYRGGKR